MMSDKKEDFFAGRKNRVIYESYRMFDLDGTFLAYVNKRKARFYIKNGQADWYDEESKRIIDRSELDDCSAFVESNGAEGDYYNGQLLQDFRLRFVSRLNQMKADGLDVEERDPYYRQRLENRCVICGTSEHLTKHHVIPSMYRRYFHNRFKSNNHHDVLPLCYECHRQYELEADILKEELLQEYGVTDLEVKTDIEKMNDEIFKARHLLQQVFLQEQIQVPSERLNDLFKKAKKKPIVLNQYSDDTMEKYRKPSKASNVIVKRVGKVKQIIKYAKKVKGIQVESMKKHQDFCEYMDYLESLGLHEEIKLIEENLYQFIFKWRKHFIDNTNPQFMPNHWEIEKRY